MGLASDFLRNRLHQGSPAILANEAMHSICAETWRTAQSAHGWAIGRYLLMPDHVHFFCTPIRDDYPLEKFVGKWKERTAKLSRSQVGVEMPLWQKQFFDHLLRSSESYEEKWSYVLANPIRAGLVQRSEDWKYQGELNELRFD